MKKTKGEECLKPEMQMDVERESYTLIKQE